MSLFPAIIQGGMGVGISGWALAHAVSSAGQLGVVSGTALDAVLMRRLVDGDPGGHYRRAMKSFPIPSVVAEALERYFRPRGREEGEPYPVLKMHKRVLDRWQEQLISLANFAEVTLAKEGHGRPVGINLLTKVQIPNLASLYGAMLAGVDYVLMGAGIPREIPGALDAMAGGDRAVIRLDVQGGSGAEDESVSFDPRSCWDGEAPGLSRPRFLPIVASNSLATMLSRKATGRIDGLVIEGPTAGGHNAPPRGERQLNERGEPLYGPRDEVDLEKIRDIGLPFWTAGGVGSPEHLQAAQAQGAEGIQVGTLFAYCRESGLSDDLKTQVVCRSVQGEVDVLTDDRASPTGFPFKTVFLDGSLSESEQYGERERVCDLGYLRTPYRAGSGRIGYRCASEPVGTFVKKGGSVEETVGRKCLCNALMSNISLGQVRKGGGPELPLLTSGDDLRGLGGFLRGRTAYSASEVLDYLLGREAAGISVT
jgi:NAD(P)H-dependent flavin oxidoreductase YrpB (nitropropane dioxygenase family)